MKPRGPLRYGDRLCIGCRSRPAIVFVEPGSFTVCGPSREDGEALCARCKWRRDPAHERLLRETRAALAEVG